MARVVKEHEYAARRNEILDTAQKLVYTKGYAQVSIQDILDDLHISKGAFYHYFRSKEELLEALFERLVDQAEQVMLPIVQDPDLSALEKLQNVLATSARWKAARKDYLMQVLRGWYADSNSFARQKVTVQLLKRVTPLITTIVYQGIQEGVFNTAFPDLVGELIMAIQMNMGKTFMALILPILESNKPDPDALQRLERLVAVITDAAERILGAPAGSLSVIDLESLKVWVEQPAENHDLSQETSLTPQPHAVA